MRTMRRSLVAALVVPLLASTAARAQAPAPPTSPAAEPGPPPADPALAPATVPAPPSVSDPMLEPVPRPKIEVATWEEALRFIRARSTDLKIAAQDVTRAEAQQRVALANALTTINAQGVLTHNLITNETAQFVGVRGSQGVTRPVRTPFPDYFNGGISLTQPVFALREWYAIGTASVARDVSRLSLEDTKRLIAVSVANAMVGVVTAERVAELNRLGLRNALERYQLTQRKTALGGGTGLDVVRARQDVASARATLVTGDESLRQAREDLGLALGVPEQVGVPPTANISGLEASARRTCRAANAIDDRPDVAALKKQVEVAHREIGRAHV